MKPTSPPILVLLVILSAVLLAACTGDNAAATLGPTVPIVTARPATPTGAATDAASPPAEASPIATPPEPTAAPPEPLASATPSATSPPPEAPAAAIRLEQVAGDFTLPTFLTHAGDDRLFVVQQRGRIAVITDPQAEPATFLDISDRVGADASERGLLSLAFHPDYAANGYFYVNYTDRGGDTVVSRFEVSAADPNAADPASEFVLLQIDQPYANHNGGQLQFGLDGYLYVGMGDGGSGGDPAGNGQNPATLLGALLRISVDGGDPYAVPADNPFSADPAFQQEIWAIGLRNPWRFSFDRLTGDLFLSDVGQNAWEEINFQAAGGPGGQNFGWNVMEASSCYGGGDCRHEGLVLPVAEYSHSEGGCSVTGGYIYRGAQFPALAGNYFFGDYCSGLIWGLFRQPDGAWLRTLVLQSGLTISSLGEDARGELYVLDHNQGGVYQLQAP